jgi:2-polyprenyl-3-methyl-5-hydroxy-6-metoxy-1,4-benzoquinol methylase
MAKAFPKSTFVGYDYHDKSIETANQRAAAAGATNARFEVGDASSYNGGPYDLIAFFDCIHDMADPAGAAQHARKALKADGHTLVVEPMASDRLEENLNPVGRVYFGASTMICVPVSMAKKGPALGAQAGEQRLREVFVDKGGFKRFRRATETPFNMVLEARP